MKHIRQHALFLITLTTLLILTGIVLVGCGTDAKPTYFINMFRDGGEVNRLSECLVELPQVDDTTITLNPINNALLTCLREIRVTQTSKRLSQRF